MRQFKSILYFIYKIFRYKQNLFLAIRILEIQSGHLKKKGVRMQTFLNEASESRCLWAGFFKKNRAVRRYVL